MRSRCMLVQIAVILALLVTTATLVMAQMSPPPGPSVAPPTSGTTAAPGGGGSAAAVILVVLGLLVIVGAGVKMYDLKRKREAEAVHLQAQVSDALLRESSLFGLPVTPTARVPMWKGTPAVLEVAGQVPTELAREAAMRII